MSQKTPPMTRRVRLTPGPVRVTHAPQLGPSVKVERHSRLTLMLSVLDGSGVGVRIETLPGESAHDSEPTNWLDLGAFGPDAAGSTCQLVTFGEALSWVRYRVTALRDGEPATIDIQGAADLLPT